jgi:hypothetical protein
VIIQSVRPSAFDQRPAWSGLALLLALCLTPWSAWGQEAHGALRRQLEKERQTATRDVAKARARVKAATDEVAVAKQRLDSLIAKHLDELGRQKATPSSEAPSGESQGNRPPEAVIAQLNQQIEDLTVRRAELLQRLTTAHPEVVNLDTRITEISTQLQLLKKPKVERESLPAGEPVDASAVSPAKEELDAQTQQARHREATLQYERAFRKWELAQHDLESALAAERSANERLSALPSSEPDAPRPSVPVVPSNTPPDVPQVPEAKTSDDAIESEHNASQALAMATLIVALAVAALAAVRLARTANETVFTNVDEVTAALALPVVGVIPAVDRSAEPGIGSRFVQGVVYLAQLFLALAVFALVAYGVQTIVAIGQGISHPIESLHDAAAYLGWL